MTDNSATSVIYEKFENSIERREYDMRHEIILHERVIVNISGAVYETCEKTLQYYPETLLGDVNKRQRYYCKDRQQYIFNRDRKSFEAILFFYQSIGKLYRPADVYYVRFLQECEFFQLPLYNITEMKGKEGTLLNEHIQNVLSPQSYDESTFRLKLWNILEHPDSSYMATITHLFSLLLIALSVVITVSETATHFDMHNPWYIVEFGLHIYFTFELSLRIILSPDRIVILKGALNIIDIAVVIPNSIAFFILRNDTFSTEILGCVRMLRVFRLFRLSKHSKGMNTMGIIIRDSVYDIQLFFVWLAIIVTFSGAIVYFIEHSYENTPFTSIPESMWWAIQTLLTIGYGDITPKTLIGKIFASIIMVFGVTTVTLPILTLMTKLQSRQAT